MILDGRLANTLLFSFFCFKNITITGVGLLSLYKTRQSLGYHLRPNEKFNY